MAVLGRGHQTLIGQRTCPWEDASTREDCCGGGEQKGLCLAVCWQVVGHRRNDGVQKTREGVVPAVKFKATLIAFAAAWGWDCLLILTALRWGELQAETFWKESLRGLF